jgi:hypothetical protein
MVGNASILAKESNDLSISSSNSTTLITHGSCSLHEIMQRSIASSDERNENETPIFLTVTEQEEIAKIRQTCDASFVIQRMAEQWNLMGLVRCHQQRNPEHALICHERALELYYQLANDCHSLTTQHRRSVPNLSSSCSDTTKQQNLSYQKRLAVATVLNDMGFCHERIHQYDHAKACYQSARHELIQHSTALDNDAASRKSMMIISLLVHRSMEDDCLSSPVKVQRPRSSSLSVTSSSIATLLSMSMSTSSTSLSSTSIPGSSFLYQSIERGLARVESR